MKMVTFRAKIALLLLLQFSVPSLSFSMSQPSPSSFKGELYGIRFSGWRSPRWNWGYAVGTGHDCAAICRKQYSKKGDRVELVKQLMDPAESIDDRKPHNFEEAKLVLALAWQRGRWDGSDGGPGGYGDVLRCMAEAERYEVGTEKLCSIRLIQDMKSRFPLLEPANEQELAMEGILNDSESDSFDHDKARRRCCGLVLSAIGFVDRGI